MMEREESMHAEAGAQRRFAQAHLGDVSKESAAVAEGDGHGGISVRGRKREGETKRPLPSGEAGNMPVIPDAATLGVAYAQHLGNFFEPHKGAGC